MVQIRTLREGAGLTQTELARRIGVTPSAVSIIEKPGRFPDVSRLPEIADALGCTIDALFGRSTSSIAGEEDLHHGV